MMMMCQAVAVLLLCLSLTLGAHSSKLAKSAKQSAAVSTTDSDKSPMTCGTTKEGVVFRRIVGGRKALKDEFPYQVALEHRSFYSPVYRQFCGGSIIDDRWIVTAAHCIVGENVNFMRIVAGTVDLSASNGNAVLIEKVIRHERYNSFTVENDVALLKTKSPIRTSIKEYSNSICLPSSGQQVNSLGFVTGFGTTREGGATSRQLLAAPIDILPDAVCSSVYGWQYRADGMLCAGVMKGGRDSCQGDSGGPLAFKTDAGYVLAGITSYGRGCARVNTPGIYTRVSQYTDWIKGKMQAN